MLKMAKNHEIHEIHEKVAEKWSKKCHFLTKKTGIYGRGLRYPSRRVVLTLEISKNRYFPYFPCFIRGPISRAETILAFLTFLTGQRRDFDHKISYFPLKNLQFRGFRGLLAESSIRGLSVF